MLDVRPMSLQFWTIYGVLESGVCVRVWQHSVIHTVAETHGRLSLRGAL